MKVVCISNNPSDLQDWDFEHFSPRLKHLTIGKVYEGVNISDVSNPYNNNYKRSLETIDIFIKDDEGIDIWIPYYLFSPLSIIRDRKLEELGI